MTVNSKLLFCNACFDIFVILYDLLDDEPTQDHENNRIYYSLKSFNIKLTCYYFDTEDA